MNKLKDFLGRFIFVIPFVVIMFRDEIYWTKIGVVMCIISIINMHIKIDEHKNKEEK